MNAKSLKKAYQSLSLICYREKFLIPQSPFPPAVNYRIAYYNIMRKRLSKEKSIANCNQVIKERIANQDQQYLELKALYQKNLCEYKQKMEKYKEEYLDPPTLYRSIAPHLIFIKQYYLYNQNTPLNLGQISKKYMQLSRQEKQVYERICQQQRLKLLPRYNEYIANHLIPPIVQPNHRPFNPYQIFLTQQSNQISIENASQQLYMQLSDEEKRSLQEKADQKNAQVNKKYHQFLEKWNINQEQLQYIIKISAQYEQLKSKKKKGSQNQKTVHQDEQNTQIE